MKEIEILDLSAEQPNPAKPFNGKFHHKRDRHGRIVMRDPSTVDAIVVHQTACKFGPASDPVKKHRRALNVSAHCTAFQDGTVVIGHPLLAYVFHGNLLNARSIGLECEGIFPGVMIPGHEMISDLALAAYTTAMRILVEQARALGCPIKYVLDHRQSSASRRSDPGEEIHRKVVREFAVNGLGLKTQVDLVVGDGRAIPRAWDPDGHVAF
jgi:hypothetical protein